MSEVLLTFLDGEVLPAEAGLIDFSSPVLHVTSGERGGNNSELTVPLTSLKYVVFGGQEEAAGNGEHLGKVVIHFSDGEVIRAYAEKNTLGGPYGIIYSLVDPLREVRRRIGVPFTAVKAIYKVRQWDSRRPDTGDSFAKVAKILARREEDDRAERAGKPTRPRRRRPLLERTRRS